MHFAQYDLLGFMQSDWETKDDFDARVYWESSRPLSGTRVYPSFACCPEQIRDSFIRSWEYVTSA